MSKIEKLKVEKADNPRRGLKHDEASGAVPQDDPSKRPIILVGD